ncbi:MAG: ABC-type branched-chain amino acid transport system, substrate-binding protein [Chloroflexi bacterium]|jgi:branched-chain amino acid transport system substrate-binding protein|nr:MAG: ABC-type branched-chain amino acid transport system, substrate-binding protein [Chloroflexota bacterium]
MKKLTVRLPMFLLALVGLVALLAAACGSDPTATQRPADTPVPTEVPPQVVTMGLTAPFSGALAVWGDVMRVSATSAFDWLESHDEVPGYTFELQIEDSRGEAAAGVSALRKLVSVDHVPVIMTIFTSIALAQAPIADDLGVVLVGSGVQHPDFGKMSQWTFRNGARTADNSDVLYRYFSEVKGEGPLKWGLIHLSGNDSVLLQVDRLKKLVDLMGGEVVATETYLQEDKDFRSSLTKLKAAKPDVVFYVTLGSEFGALLNQSVEVGLDPKYKAGLLAEAGDVITVSGQAAEGLVYVSPAFNPDDPDPQLQKYLSDYRKEMGKEVDGFAAAYYDGALLVAEAVKRGGGVSSQQIADGFRTITEFTGVSGKITFDPTTGDGWQSLQIKGVVDQQYKTIEPLISAYFDIP